MARQVRLTPASNITPRNRPRVRVTTRPNTSYVGGVLFTFEEDCPYCGARHTGHGSPSGQPSTDGTYGHRVPHCGPHTHVLTASGRRARLTDRNECHEWHEQYILVPAEGVS